MLIDKTLPQTVYDIYHRGKWIETFEVQDDTTACEYAMLMYDSPTTITISKQVNGKTVYI